MSAQSLGLGAKVEAPTIDEDALIRAHQTMKDNETLIATARQEFPERALGIDAMKAVAPGRAQMQLGQELRMRAHAEAWQDVREGRPLPERNLTLVNEPAAEGPLYGIEPDLVPTAKRKKR